jgi:hypothetical protein
LKYIIFCIRWNGSNVHFVSKQVRNNWTNKSQKKRLRKTKVSVTLLQFFHFANSWSLCRSPEAHWIEALVSWPPFRWNVLGSGSAFFTMKWYVKRLSSLIKSLMRYQKKHDFQDSKNFDSEIKGLLRFLSYRHVFHPPFFSPRLEGLFLRPRRVFALLTALV